MKNLDIKNFSTLSGVTIGDYFLMVTKMETDGKLSVESFVTYMRNLAQPQISETTGNWVFTGIDGSTIDTGVKAAADTPVFRKQDGAIVWKYTSEDDTQWRTLVEIGDIKFNPSDLTEEQWRKIKLNYSDLTEEDKQDLRSVFLGVVNRAEQAAIGYENATNEIYKSISSAAEANERALKAQKAAESAQKAAEEQRDQTIAYLDEVKADEAERVKSENKRKQQEAARVDAEKKRTDDWQAWFDNETSGVKALWAAWYTNTQNAFNTWFGATENEGVRKSVSDWLAEVQRLWTAFYGADSNSGVRGNWAAWLQSVTNDWSNKLTSVDNDWSSAKEAINTQWAALMKVINDNWAEKQSTIDTEWSDKKTEITNAWNTWFGADETLGIRGEYKAWYDTLVADWDKWYGATKEGYATWLADSKKEWNDTKAGYDKEWNDAKARYDKEWSDAKAGYDNEWSDIKTNVSNEWAAQKKAIDDAWNAWYGTSSTTGIQGVWATWFAETTQAFSNWFGATESDGVRGDWDAWLAQTMNDWNALSGSVNEAIGSVNDAIANANDAADNANNMANHPPYVGEDMYWYVWNNSTKTYDKTDKYSKGDGFSIKKTFPSVAEMEAYVNPGTATTENPILKSGDFVIISSNAEDEDNSKLYVVQNVTPNKISYGFLTDMSGARGFAGHTPQLSIGTITTGEAGTSANVSLTENGTDDNGNPKYLINFVIPKGEKGDKGDAFTYNDFTDEQIAGLQKPATDAAAVALSAAETANNKATLANNAATNANEKAELANTAATDANNAAAKANDAAAKVSSAITDTEAAATKANDAAAKADDAAAKANAAVDGFNWDNLKDKPSSFTPSAHTHAISEVANLQATLDGKAAASHTHAISNVTNLQATLDGKAAASHTHAIADITNISSASVSYASSAGNANTATLLALNTSPASTVATAVGSWSPVSSKVYVYRQRWTNSAAGSDTADLSIYLDGNLTANMCLDGYYYSLLGFKKDGSSDSYVLLGGGGHKAESSLSVANADTLDGYHAGSLWRSDGGSWNPNANIELNASGNDQEWSFDIHRNGYTGCYWHVWDSSHGTMLQVNPNNGKVYAPYNFVGNLEGNASTASNADTLDGYHYSSFAMASHSHSYLPLSGGTLKGELWTIAHLRFNNCGAGAAENSGGKLIFQNSGTVHACIATTIDGNVWVAGRTTTDFSGAIILSPGSSNTSIFRGAIKCSSLTQTSDVRMKNILSDVVIGLDDIVCAPLFEYSFRNDENMKKHIGTSAQYWEANYSGCFTKMGDDGYYSMEYANLGVAMGISLAREIVKYESKTDKKIRLMKKKINLLEARVKELEGRMTA